MTTTQRPADNETSWGLVGQAAKRARILGTVAHFITQQKNNRPVYWFEKIDHPKRKSLPWGLVSELLKTGEVYLILFTVEGMPTRWVNMRYPNKRAQPLTQDGLTDLLKANGVAE